MAIFSTDFADGSISRSEDYSNRIKAGAYGDDYIGYGNGVYAPRLTAPSSTNKYFKTTYNPCISPYEDGNSLPNCVGYAYGRAMELSNLWRTEMPKYMTYRNYKTLEKGTLSINDAYTFWEYTVWRANHGLYHWAYGQLPRLGAIICWYYLRGVTSAEGHVGIVEKINYKKDGSIESIVTSNSAYKSTKFYTQILYPESINGKYTWSPNYHLQGFIYPPYVAYFAKDAGAQYTEGDAPTVTQACGLTMKTVVLPKAGGGFEYYTGAISNYNPEGPGIDPTSENESATDPEPKYNTAQTVVITGIGNTASTGNGKEIDGVKGSIGYIKAIKPGMPYMYMITSQPDAYTKATFIGYFKETDLEEAKSV